MACSCLPQSIPENAWKPHSYPPVTNVTLQQAPQLHHSDRPRQPHHAACAAAHLVHVLAAQAGVALLQPLQRRASSNSSIQAALQPRAGRCTQRHSRQAGRLAGKYVWNRLNVP
jgi:hypothetical protein